MDMPDFLQADATSQLNADFFTAISPHHLPGAAFVSANLDITCASYLQLQLETGQRKGALFHLLGDIGTTVSRALLFERIFELTNCQSFSNI